jgi:hypothetical protein
MANFSFPDVANMRQLNHSIVSVLWGEAEAGRVGR